MAAARPDITDGEADLAVPAGDRDASCRDTTTPVLRGAPRGDSAFEGYGLCRSDIAGGIAISPVVSRFRIALSNSEVLT
jgi:hypothetical protein